MHAIIALWCHPRSISTAMERVMRERGDLNCFHEPFMYDYYRHRNVRDMPMFEPEPGRPIDFATITQALIESARHKPVFFKDMSYYIASYLNTNEDFFSSIKNVFLIRDPRRSIPSYYKLDNHVTLEEIGIESQFKHAQWLAQSTNQWPLILNAETICNDPERSIRQLFAELQLPFRSEALDWSTNVPAQWQEVAGWHQSVMQSNGLQATKSDIDADDIFNSAAESHPELRHYLNHHQPFYKKLLTISQQQYSQWIAKKSE